MTPDHRSDPGFGDRSTLVDWPHAAYLGHRLWAATACHPDGSTWPWALTDDRDAPAGCCCPRCAPHDQAGPLPPRYTARLASVAPRCGRPRADGQPCRAWVATPGAACRWHRPSGGPR